FSDRFFELAEKNPKDPAAVDALIWVVTHASTSATNKDGLRARALDQLLREHMDSDKLASLCGQLVNGMDKGTETFLRTVLQKNKHRDVQGQACLALARYLGRRASSLDQLKDNPRMLTSYENFLGKEYLQELMKQDPKERDKEIERLFDRV